MSETPLKNTRRKRKTAAMDGKNRLQSLASSTAIETGEPIQQVEERIIRLRARRDRARLA